ncbi:MAG: hypothetical protein GY853_09440 [PVC group bacterium]|nr:hypothetical protein [PVC group bacterium]
MKYYGAKNEDGCFPLQHFKLKQDDVILELLKRDVGSGYFYCAEFDEVGESSQGGCGQDCKKYQPRNKKSGRCRFHQNTFIGTGQYFKLGNNKLERLNEKV